MKLIIREYRDADYGVCRSLWTELTERHRLIYDDLTIGGVDPGSGLEDYLRNPGRHATWVAEADGHVVGMTGLIVRGTEAEIEPAVVTAACRSRGVGHALVGRAVDEAKRMGIRFLSVHPVARNVEAISFLVGCGFEIVGHVDLFQDLAPSQGRQWKVGITIHGHKLRY
jgi:GNAT superfamily N-acetyltransferase